MKQYELAPHDLRYQISFGQIHKDAFSEQSLNEISIWFYKNRKNLSYHTVTAIQRVYLTQERSETLPKHIIDYCPEAELQYAIQTIQTLPRRVRHLIPSIVAFATKYDNVTCHELLFRTKQDPVVSQMPCTFLNLLQTASDYECRMIKKRLQEHTEEIHDIAYVIKARLLELADDKGVDFLKMYMPFCSDNVTCQHLNLLFNDLSCLWKKAKDGYKEDLSSLINDSNILLSLVCTISIYFDVSVDWFLLHDYSLNAVKPDGSKLSEKETEFLSLFLRADFPTQSMVIADLIAAKTRGCILPLA